ncbi:MAG: hypothetical protein VB070_11805 [Clostridiaceae bacterium]|nr:hypothetical protein [Clostridiaceae bacterium]
MTQLSADNKTMLEYQQLKNRLPVISRRAGTIRGRLKDIDRLLVEQRDAVASEGDDVDRLDNKTLGNYLLGLSRQMDKKRQKEEEELLQAKRKLDETISEQTYLRRELADLEQQMAAAQQAGRSWEQGMQERLNWLEEPENHERREEYRQIQSQINSQQAQATEIDQARAVARQAAATAEAMREQLASAENWSTYDVWFDGGIISHAAKYNHLDAVSDMANHLAAQLNDLRRELADIHQDIGLSLNEYSGGTRVLDYFFDNIFTDLSVRDRIRDDQASVDQARDRLRRLDQELERSLEEIRQNLTQLTAKQEQYLLQLAAE